MRLPPKSPWTLDPEVDFLNHGSFGACPLPVLEEQQRLRTEIERQPVDFFVRKLPGLLDAARVRLAAFVGADPAGLVPVTNATTGVNTVLRSLPFAAGDEVLVTDHAYSACRNALDAVAADRGVAVVVARIPFPLAAPGEVVERVLAARTRRTRVALLDHVTSPTGLIFPIEALVRELESGGVACLVDGAHAPGMLPLDLRALGASFYTGNCHKWICAPKGAGFLWVRHDLRDLVRPLVISHGASASASQSRLHAEFDWVGTADPTAFLSVPAALSFFEARDGGWPAVRAANHLLVLEARRLLCAALGIQSPAPDDMLGSLASVPLPATNGASRLLGPELDPLQETLRFRYRVEVPVMRWSESGRRVLRVSAQLYNSRAQYVRLCAALRAEIRELSPSSGVNDPGTEGSEEEGMG